MDGPSVGSLDDGQRKAFEEYKLKIEGWIKPKRHYDDYLLRFLRARQYDVDKAVDMFITSMKWREAYGADEILKTFPQSKYFQLLKNYWPGVHIGQTKGGSFVFVERIGTVDPKSLFRSVPPDELLRFHVYSMEGHEKLIRKQHKKLAGWGPLIVVQDCKGIGLKHTMKAGIDFIRKISELDSANYPEILRKMYFINAPSLFTGIFAMLKPFIDPVTLSKLEVLGTNFFDSLTELVDISVLPTCIGGTNTMPFPEAGIFETTLTKQGTSVTVSSGDKYRHEVAVTRGSRVEYSFATEDYNISFGIFHKAHGSASTPGSPALPASSEKSVVEPIKHESHQETIWAEYRVGEDGVVILEWDNSYSKWRSKSLLYHVHVHPHSISEPTTPTQLSPAPSAPKRIKKKVVVAEGSEEGSPGASNSAWTSTSASSAPSSPTHKEERLKQDSGSRSSSPEGSPVLSKVSKRSAKATADASEDSSDTLGF